MSEPEEFPAYWLGRLPAAMAAAASDPSPEDAREILRRVLLEYLRSGVPSEFTKTAVRKELER